MQAQINTQDPRRTLTHVPVILSIVGFVTLVVAVLRRNDTLTKAAFYMLLFAGLSAVPVFLTGEGAEETVEHLPGVTEPVIEKHEELAKIAFSLASAAAIVSVVGLLLYFKARIRRLIQALLLLLAFASSAIMAVTAQQKRKRNEYIR